MLIGCWRRSMPRRRNGTRGVVNEHILVSALNDAFGADQVHVFTGGAMDRIGIQRQMAVFRHAHIIIGMI